MTKTLLDFLHEHELEQLAEWKKLRLKSRADATFYAAQIKNAMDRARARMNKAKEESK